MPPLYMLVTYDTFMQACARYLRDWRVLIANRPEEVVDSLGWAEAQREIFARINLREKERE